VDSENLVRKENISQSSDKEKIEKKKRGKKTDAEGNLFIKHILIYRLKPVHQNISLHKIKNGIIVPENRTFIVGGT